MQFYYVRRVILVALLSTAMLTLAPIMARAEILTLQCSGGNGYFTIDLSAQTVTWHGASEIQEYSNVKISDSTISFVVDHPPAYRHTTRIDRTTGMSSTQIYYYPEGGASGPSGWTSQCTKIPNKIPTKKAF